MSASPFGWRFRLRRPGFSSAGVSVFDAGASDARRVNQIAAPTRHLSRGSALRG